MSPRFVAPTAAEILARMAADPQFAAIVAEHVSADLEWSSAFMTGADYRRHLDARAALYDALPGAREAQDEQMRLGRERDAREAAEKAAKVAA